MSNSQHQIPRIKLTSPDFRIETVPCSNTSNLQDNNLLNSPNTHSKQPFIPVSHTGKYFTGKMFKPNWLNMNLDVQA